MKTVILLLVSGALYGQRLIYNSDLDKKGQEAAAAANKIASESLTAKELQNLKTIEKQQIDGELKAGYLSMRSEIQAFDRWSRVSRAVCFHLRQLYAADDTAALKIAGERSNRAAFDLTCKPAALAAAKDAAQASKKLLTASSPGSTAGAKDLVERIGSHVAAVKGKFVAAEDEQVAAAETAKGTAGGGKRVTASTKAAINETLDRLGNVDEILKAAQQLPLDVAGAQDAIGQLEDGLAQVDLLLDVADNILQTYADIQVDPRSLMPSKEKLAASLLALEAQRIKELAAVRASDELFRADLRVRLEDCVSLLDQLGLWYSEDSVEATLTNAGTPERRFNVLYSLHLAAAGAAVNQTPFGVRAVRESLAERRYSIRREALYNGGYEQALQASAQRLSAYYGAGITKNQVAQLLYYLSGLVSLPSIAF